MKTTAIAHLFVGPSGPPSEALICDPRVEVHPPIRRGDLLRLIPARPRIVGIIDGFFAHAPAVQHKEILTAMDSGIRVLGGASMGALRAAELDRYGMEGIGAVYREYASGTLTSDAELAVLHSPPSFGSALLTVPLVDVRFALRRESIHASIADAVLATASRIQYRDRTPALLFARLAEQGIGVEELGDAYLSLKDPLKGQKHRDCLDVCAAVLEAAERDASPRRYSFSNLETVWLAHHRLEYGWRISAEAADRDALSVAKLLWDEYPALHRRVLLEAMWSPVERATGQAKYVDKYESASAADADCACLLALWQGASAVDAHQFPPEEARAVSLDLVYHLRRRNGGLPDADLISAIEQHPDVSQLRVLIKDVMEANELAKRRGVGDHRLLPIDKIARLLMRRTTSGSAQLSDWVRQRGFLDNDELWMALRLCAAYLKQHQLRVGNR